MRLSYVVLVVCVAGLTAPSRPDIHAAQASAPRSANDRLLEPGPEAQQLARRVGTWDVVNTIHPAPDATPIVTKGLVAERIMIGLYLQEVLKPAPASEIPDFRRIEYLTYNAVESRWQYVSLDTRVPIGLMPARSYDHESGRGITLHFDNWALPGFSSRLEARLTRARHVTTIESENRDVSRQYWSSPGMQEWLAVEYAYTRRR